MTDREHDLAMAVAASARELLARGEEIDALRDQVASRDALVAELTAALRAVTAASPWDHVHAAEDPVCAHCGAELPPGEYDPDTIEHEDGCAYVAAEALLERIAKGR